MKKIKKTNNPSSYNFYNSYSQWFKEARD